MPAIPNLRAPVGELALGYLIPANGTAPRARSSFDASRGLEISQSRDEKRRSDCCACSWGCQGGALSAWILRVLPCTSLVFCSDSCSFSWSLDKGQSELRSERALITGSSGPFEVNESSAAAIFLLHPRKRRNTERGPGGRGPGVVPGGVGSKNRGGHVRVQIEAYKTGTDRRSVYTVATLPVCLYVCPWQKKLPFFSWRESRLPECEENQGMARC